MRSLSSRSRPLRPHALYPPTTVRAALQGGEGWNLNTNSCKLCEGQDPTECQKFEAETEDEAKAQCSLKEWNLDKLLCISCKEENKGNKDICQTFMAKTQDEAVDQCWKLPLPVTLNTSPGQNTRRELSNDSSEMIRIRAEAETNTVVKVAAAEATAIEAEASAAAAEAKATEAEAKATEAEAKATEAEANATEAEARAAAEEEAAAAEEAKGAANLASAESRWMSLMATETENRKKAEERAKAAEKAAETARNTAWRANQQLVKARNRIQKDLATCTARMCPMTSYTKKEGHT